MRVFTLRLGKGELQYDRDYGIDRRHGWSFVFDGCVRVQFVSLPAALWAMLTRRRYFA